MKNYFTLRVKVAHIAAVCPKCSINEVLFLLSFRNTLGPTTSFRCSVLAAAMSATAEVVNIEPLGGVMQYLYPGHPHTSRLHLPHPPSIIYCFDLTVSYHAQHP